jgi:hypothetical protein
MLEKINLASSILVSLLALVGVSNFTNLALLWQLLIAFIGCLWVSLTLAKKFAYSWAKPRAYDVSGRSTEKRPTAKILGFIALLFICCDAADRRCRAPFLARAAR